MSDDLEFKLPSNVLPKNRHIAIGKHTILNAYNLSKAVLLVLHYQNSHLSLFTLIRASSKQTHLFKR